MFIFLDTEITGNGPDDRLCQIAFKSENGPAIINDYTIECVPPASVTLS
jgi:hypothetical protein